MEKKVIISAKHLKKVFGDKGNEQVIYNDLNLEIYEGDFTIIMGQSGAGKSTLMYSLSGMDRPNEGSIIFNNIDITTLNSNKLSEFRRINCGFVFQQIYLIEKMSLMDNVLTVGLLSNKKKSDVINYAKELFNLVNIKEEIQKKTSQMISGGEAQRAGIVRAVINCPKVLFADEPTGALNSSNSKAVLDVFTKLHNNNQTIIMVTHDKKSALRGNRVIYVKDGIISGECELGKYSDEEAREKRLDAFLMEMGW